MGDGVCALEGRNDSLPSGEILEGLEEGEEVVTGSYRAISQDLENNALVVINNNAKPAGGK